MSWTDVLEWFRKGPPYTIAATLIAACCTWLIEDERMTVSPYIRDLVQCGFLVAATIALGQFIDYFWRRSSQRAEEREYARKLLALPAVEHNALRRFVLEDRRTLWFSAGLAFLAPLVRDGYLKQDAIDKHPSHTNHDIAYTIDNRVWEFMQKHPDAILTVDEKRIREGGK